MKKIAINIRHLRKLRRWSQEQLGEELGISRSRIGSYEEGRCDPPVEVLIKMSSVFHVAIDALIRCDLSRVDPAALMKVGENRLLFPVIVDRHGEEQVEVVTVKASAGYLNGFADPEFIEQLPLMKLPFKVTGKHRAFPIRGDSMPPLQEGDYVICRYVESADDVRDGMTCVLVTREEGLTYKRVCRKDRETLELHSSNKYYKPYEVKLWDILEIWEFTCSLHTSELREEEVNTESVMQMLRSMQVELERLKG